MEFNQNMRNKLTQRGDAMAQASLNAWRDRQMIRAMNRPQHVIVESYEHYEERMERRRKFDKIFLTLIGIFFVIMIIAIASIAA